MKELELSAGPEREAFILSLLDRFIDEHNGRPVSDTMKDVFMIAKDEKGDLIHWSDAETLFNSLASIGCVHTSYVESTECPAHARTDDGSLFALSYLVEGFIDRIKAGDENIYEYGKRLMAFLCTIILPCPENFDAVIRLRDSVQAKLHKLYCTVITKNNLCYEQLLRHIVRMELMLQEVPAERINTSIDDNNTIHGGEPTKAETGDCAHRMKTLH